MDADKTIVISYVDEYDFQVIVDDQDGALVWEDNGSSYNMATGVATLKLKADRAPSEDARTASIDNGCFDSTGSSYTTKSMKGSATFTFNVYDAELTENGIIITVTIEIA